MGWIGRGGASVMVVGLVLAGVGVGGARGQGSGAGSGDVLRTLRKGHPRLYVTAETFEQLKTQVKTDPLLKTWYASLEKSAEAMIDQPPVVHRLIGPRLLDQSRKALARISTLAGLYRIDGDPRKAERARVEMLAAAGFDDWNPSHFLDVAEMTNALAIGYDWLHDQLSAEDRATIRRAIVEKGLRPGMKVYESGKGWPKAVHNWNQVCNGGMTVGALAVAEEEPTLARQILNHGRASIVNAMKSFAPDGGWAEGPGYWDYATEYNVFYLAALETALGTDFGLKGMPGFSVTSGFRMQSVGPLGKTFNYADAGDRAGSAPQMFWLARTFRHPDAARHEIETMKGQVEIFHLLWSAGPAWPAAEKRPLDAVYRGIDVAFFRSAWNDPKAVYVGFKGGDNAANHSHLDLGTFVLDALGERWALDLGGDDYNLPGYFGKQRWTYYRLRTEGHNTLTINEENQAPRAKAPLIASGFRPGLGFAVADLTEAYAPRARRVLRGVALRDGNSVVIQDEIELREPADIRWNYHTSARIESRGDHAVLTLGSTQLEARILEPARAHFSVISANPPAPQRQQPDVHNLVIDVPRTSKARIVVRIAEAGAKASPVEPLRDWLRDAGTKRSGIR